MAAPTSKWHFRRGEPTKGMLNDIWETPSVLKAMLKEHLKPGAAPFDPPARPAGGQAPAAREYGVHLPRLSVPLPPEHGLAGQTPLEVMAACYGGASGPAQRFTIIGSGTSFNAALLAEYLIEHIARIPVDVRYASEYRYLRPIVRKGDVVIVVSNSGETAESVESLRLLKECPAGKGVLKLGMVNVEDSTIAKESDQCMFAKAGREQGATSTKAFSATLVQFALLAVALGEACGTLPDGERNAILEKLAELPTHVETVIQRESRPLKQDSGDLEVGSCRLWDIGCQNVLAQNFIFLGRGFNFPIALEGAMKVKEIAYIHAEGYPAAEMKHGPIALIDQFMPVVVICPRADQAYEKIKANIEEVNARSGATIAITEDDNEELSKFCEYVIQVPGTHEYLMPLISVIPLQLFSYMMGVLRGNEVDAPRGLQKSISSSVARVL